jgi:hypothetical protein
MSTALIPKAKKSPRVPPMKVDIVKLKKFIAKYFSSFI